MQYFTLIGGFIGFVLTFLVSLVAGKNLEDTVFNATIGCVITALLFRLFRLAIEYCAKQVVAEKARLRDLEQATPAEPAPSPESTPETPVQPAA
jgi:phosphotransferase system  glucose/maltose/N-acetylglucosamine-specific IIC component